MKTESLGNFIRGRRSERHISLRALARQIKTSPTFLSDIELGRRFPSRTVLARIALTLDISPDVLSHFDHRSVMAALGGLVRRDPDLTKALNNLVNQLEKGNLTANELMRKLETDNAVKSEN
jgi:transcriptional regulator with XRE-family HTH domain